ncbi:MAG: hypothetical protein N4J56_004145 [Chroococcidiopsis sp. SAG 2025]|nr:hypothetical protein [Chroococcidiopsis sp. SAG 2025]MDV2994491.1 hypothetical protein [Chroococcidiopsis sp. SAG 2025]
MPNSKPHCGRTSRVLKQPEATAPEPQNIVLFQQFEGRKHHEFSTR